MYFDRRFGRAAENLIKKRTAPAAAYRWNSGSDLFGKPRAKRKG